ncbi:hypothetical protein BDW74DRAFT_160193 [Aspergillus multicolor]|uniref:uncharacterized protein n=1 Tax=Aspergillus multicolor TaxID=41759 RepID=UPI003CCD7391
MDYEKSETPIDLARLGVSSWQSLAALGFLAASKRKSTMRVFAPAVGQQNYYCVGPAMAGEIMGLFSQPQP